VLLVYFFPFRWVRLQFHGGTPEEKPADGK